MAAVLVIGLMLFVQGMIHTLLHTRLFNRRPTFSDTYAVAEILFFTGSSANTISQTPWSIVGAYYATPVPL